MASVANEIDEFSSLFDLCDNSINNGYDEESLSFSDEEGNVKFKSKSKDKPKEFVLKVPSIGFDKDNKNETSHLSSSKEVRESSLQFHTLALATMIPFSSTTTFSQPTNSFTPLERKRKGTQDQEERRLRNREAADKSRQKRNDLLKSLPARNAQLEARVQDLECGLAASKAEAASLREQCSFLKSLIGNKLNYGASAEVFSVSPDYDPSFMPNSTQGVLLLAVCCIVTVNQWGVLDDQVIEAYSDISHNGGRILLSTSVTDDESSADLSINRWWMNCIMAGLYLLCGGLVLPAIVGTLQKLFESSWPQYLPLWSSYRCSILKSHES
jgi:hypothetical protein